jgi:YwiC-like protein
MFPKEHGAYGQLLFPLVTALAVGRPSGAALLLAAAAIAAFFAHEPLLILIGQRGARAARARRRQAAVWFGGFAAAAAVSGAAAIALATPGVRLAIAAPAALAAALAVFIIAQRERTTVGEALTAVTLSSVAFPVALAADASSSSAITCAAVFAAVFVSGTIGVRAVIAQTRRVNAPAMRTSALVVSAASFALLWWGAGNGLLARSAPWAALPVCLLALWLTIAPPAAKHLRSVGWALVATTAASAALLIVALR